MNNNVNSTQEKFSLINRHVLLFRCRVQTVIFPRIQSFCIVYRSKALLIKEEIFFYSLTRMHTHSRLDTPGNLDQKRTVS